MQAFLPIVFRLIGANDQEHSLADLSFGAAPRLCADQPVIASAFLDLAQICILTSVASFGLSQCRISRAKAFHQFILIVLG